MMTSTATPLGTISTASTTTTGTGTGIRTSPAVQKVVIVNGSPDVMALLEAVLDAGHYDIVFVESNEHAYSDIKRVRPHLVILCMRIEDRDGFLVLSMLKLDDETRRIPVLTYTTEYEGQDADNEVLDASEMELFVASARALPMN
jgi:PleD family two-component response regulator